VEKFAMSSLKGSEYGSELANSMPEGEKKRFVDEQSPRDQACGIFSSRFGSS
jgi:hypothetical protein